MKYSGQDLVLGGLFSSLALVVPFLFHAIGLRSAFLPMFFQVIIAGFLVVLPVAMAVGFISPLTFMRNSQKKEVNFNLESE